MRSAILLLGLLLAIGTPSLAREAKSHAVVSTAVPTPLLEAVAQSLILAQKRDFQGAYALASKAVASPAYASPLTPADAAVEAPYRLELMSILAQTASLTGRFDEAGKAFQVASEMQGATAANWLLRLNFDIARQNPEDGLIALIRLTRGFPEVARTNISIQTVGSLAAQMRPLPDRSEKLFSLWKALLDIDWAPSGEMPFSAELANFAGRSTMQGDIVSANKALDRVTGSDTLIAIRADKRFDAYVAAHPAKFDITASAAAILELRRAAQRGNPASLMSVMQLTSVLDRYGKGAEALTLLDAALASAKPGDGSASPYVDPGELNWVYDQRARALRNLGRYDEAINAMLKGATRPDKGRVNVSQPLNLADLYLSLGRWDDALKIATDVERGDTSAYGNLVKQHIIACASAKLGDDGGRDAALSILRDSSGGDLSGLSSALICIGDEEAAARLLISRLEDPDQRLAALREVQNFPKSEAIRTPYETVMEELKRRIRARADVRDAVEKVGRFEEQTLPIG